MRPLVALLLMAVPVEAHCYSVWKYPRPQHCGGVYARADHSWTVEIVKEPPAWRDRAGDGRTAAIEALKRQLNR